MILKETDSENPNLHWEFVKCKDRVCLDLGCGRWESVEYRDPNWPTTPEWLIQNGAKKVYAFDLDENEINWYNENICKDSNISAFTLNVSSVNDIRNIINEYKPEMIKCDIEGFEYVLLELTDEEFSSIRHYALETHSDDLYKKFVEKFTNLGYDIIASIDLIHARPMKALFAEKI
jgi:hypothetical protein